MKKKLLVVLLSALTLTTACGNAKYDNYAAATASPMYEATYDSYDSYEAYDDYGEYAEESITASATADKVIETSENATTTNRKLIRNVDINVETKEYDNLMGNISQQIASFGGYVEYMNVDNGSYYSSRSRRYANITARIPAKQLDAFLSQVGEVANITNKTESVRDITLSYVDMESHKNMLIAERDNLLKLLEQAETIEEMITVEDRLTEIRYQIDSMESQLRTYDNQVDYSTVTINVSEVIAYTPVVEEEKTTWQRISEGFIESITDIGHGIKEFFIGFIIALPYLVIWAIIIFVIITIIRSLLRMSKKYRSWSDEKRANKEAKKAEKKAAKLAAKEAKEASKTEGTN